MLRKLLQDRLGNQQARVLFALGRVHRHRAGKRKEHRSAQAVNVRHLVTDLRFRILLDRPAAGVNILDQVRARAADRLHLEIRQDHLAVRRDAQRLRRDAEVVHVLPVDVAERMDDRNEVPLAVRPGKEAVLLHIAAQ